MCIRSFNFCNMAKYYTTLSYVYIVFNAIYLTSSSPNMVLPCVSWGRLMVPVGAFKNFDLSNTPENRSERKLIFICFSFELLENYRQQVEDHCSSFTGLNLKQLFINPLLTLKSTNHSILI